MRRRRACPCAPASGRRGPWLIVWLITFFRAAMQPDLVGEVRRAQRRIALAVGAVAGDAVLHVDVLAERHAERVGGQPRERAHVVRHVLHALLAERGPNGGMTPLRPSAMVVLIASGVPPHSQLDVGEVGEAARAGAVRGVALRAVVEEQLLADGERFRVLRERLDARSRRTSGRAGPNCFSARGCSSFSCPTCDQPSVPGQLPRPG